ncbi:DHA2 family efflux MFS transporter permease subunit [uncultured Limosilactobacillus sp.]|uniref:DHA2 family efflux MFS transporter permease subunit n=1 Tax=uncultured Limosilactobacillus sp. TaxID=2837629 RepID=UPI0025D892AA|nr:DHA2 family efflux MFS transporter permease subunit [uncultured Limosilactobacillus sp.]
MKTQSNFFNSNPISIAILFAGTLLGLLTQNMMATILTPIINDFQISASTAGWLTTIYSLIASILVPVSAFFTKRYSCRQLFSFSMLTFTIGSFIGIIATNFKVLLFSRILQGIGTGILMSLLQIAIYCSCSIEQRNKLMGIIGVSMGFAPAFGPVLSGFMSDAWSWKSVFVLLTIMGAILLFLSLLLLKNLTKQEENCFLDKLSLLLSSVGFSGFTLGISFISQFGLKSAITLSCLAAGLLIIFLFIHRQFRVSQPLLQLETLKNKGMLTGTLFTFLLFTAFNGVSVVLPLYMQKFIGISASVSGIVTFPGAVLVAVASLISGFLADKFGFHRLTVAASIMLCVGTGLLLTLNTGSSLVMIATVQCIRNFSIGLLIMPVTTWALNQLNTNLVSDGTEIINTVRQISGAIGTSCMLMFLQLFGVSTAFFFSLTLSILSLVIAVQKIKD